jgi:hypothetical protein
MMAAAVHGSDAAWADYDNDGDLDLYVAEGASGGRLMRNERGTLEDATTPPLDDVGLANSAAWADVDGDGDLDLYVAATGVANRLLENVTRYGNHYLDVDLGGRVSNRSAIGAKVVVQSGGIRQMREISSGSGKSANSLVAHFGLGAATAVDSIVVHWPSGIVTAGAGLAPDRRIAVSEHSGAIVGLDPPTTDPSGNVSLFPVYPNPTARLARIEYALKAPAHVRILAFDLQGRCVRVLSEGQREAGRHAVAWTGRDHLDRLLPDAIYFIRLEAGGDRSIRKLILSR